MIDTRLLDTDLELIVLNRLKKLKAGEALEISSVAKRNPQGFIEVVKRLIKCGWSEYEFSNDYKSVKRLDLPEFAREWFREQAVALKLNKNENIINISGNPNGAESITDTKVSNGRRQTA